MTWRPRTAAPPIFTVPIRLGVASLAGLVIGLVGDGWMDAAAWVGVGLPVATIGWALGTRRG